MIHLYGIPNCDTVKKARTWLEAAGLEYAFHDYKKEGADAAKLAEWVAAMGADVVLNRRGTTFRKLSDAERAQADADPVALMVAHPSLIKRPVAEHAGGLLVGFAEAAWKAALC
jgi:Spx/MgsR family transcriptional regulator